jgi:hypothetical protein
MIILTPAQANRVRGLAIPGHALAPVPLADGTFALPESVLTDPVYAQFHAGLEALPRVLDRSIRQGTRQNPDDIDSPIIDSDWEQDLVKRRRAAYSQTWRAGELVDV